MRLLCDTPIASTLSVLGLWMVEGILSASHMVKLFSKARLFLPNGHSSDAKHIVSCYIMYKTSLFVLFVLQQKIPFWGGNVLLH